MTQAWDKEKSESLTGIEPMTSRTNTNTGPCFPISDFTTFIPFNAPAQYINLAKPERSIFFSNCSVIY